MISAKGLAQEKHLQRVAVSCRVWPITLVFDISGIALAATRFMTRDDHAALRTTSKHLSQRMSATSSAVIQSKILVAGVNGPTELFDATSGRWETLPSMRKGCNEPVSAVIRGRLYVCGGLNLGTRRPCSSVESFDPLQNRWRSLRPMSVPRMRAASAVVGDHMYVCGGAAVLSDPPHNSVERFDTLSEIWEAQPAMAHTRDSAGAAVIRGRIYVVGGYAGMYGTKTRSVEGFDGAWTTVPPMTHRRVLCSRGVIAEKLYVCGGDDCVYRAPDTVERFDPTHETWELIRPTLHHRRHTTVAVLRDRLYLVGGMDDDDIALDSVECLTLTQTLGKHRLPCHTHALAQRWPGSTVLSTCSAVLLVVLGLDTCRGRRKGLTPSQGGGRLFLTRQLLEPGWSLQSVLE